MAGVNDETARTLAQLLRMRDVAAAGLLRLLGAHDAPDALPAVERAMTALADAHLTAHELVAS